MKVNSYVVPLSLFHWLALDGAYLVAKTLDVLTAMVPRVGCAAGSKQLCLSSLDQLGRGMLTVISKAFSTAG